jgi:AraC-like DNA-binding protein
MYATGNTVTTKIIEVIVPKKMTVPSGLHSGHFKQVTGMSPKSYRKDKAS